MSYYTRWGLVIGTSLFQRFLQNNYVLGLYDLQKLKKNNPFLKPDFTCLLCGVGNEETARSFIQFVTKRNPRSKIYIIDLGSEQIAAVKKLVYENFRDYDITVRQINALDMLSFLKSSSVDWIETDGFLEFFPYANLTQLLEIWYKALKPNGFITIREPASNSFLGSLADLFRIKIAKWWLGINIYKHTLKDLDKIFLEKRFRYVASTTSVPTFRRFTIIKE